MRTFFWKFSAETKKRIVRSVAGILVGIGVFSMTTGCNRISEQSVQVYLLQFSGKVRFDPEKTARGLIQTQILHAKTIPSSGSLVTGPLSFALLQIGEFITIYIGENSTFSYEIKYESWEESGNIDIRFHVFEGSIDLHRTLKGVGRDCLITINELFLVKEAAVFRYTRVNESDPQSEQQDVYETVQIKQGGVYYINPLTRSVDMYINKNHSYTIRNRIPKDISFLSKNEQTLLQSISENAPDPLSTDEIWRVLSAEQSLMQAVTRTYRPFIFGCLLALTGMSYGLYLYIRNRRMRKYSFLGALRYWDQSKSFKDICTMPISYRRNRRKLTIGSSKNCRIRLPRTKLHKDVTIHADLINGNERYFIRFSPRDIMFTKRAHPRELSFGDQFIIDSYRFEFYKMKKPKKQAKQYFTRRLR